MTVFDNDRHAASTSKKNKAVVEANAKAGKYGCKQAAYGYIKGDDEKHTPIINPETAPVVLSIFKMRAQGISPRHIADKQNAEDVDKFIERVKKYADVQKLTREMCLELIEYVTIDKHPSDRKAERDIHIYYKFLDKPVEHSLHNLYE